MASEVNWGLVIAAGILVGLLILALIAGLYLLLNPPPVSEPPGTPDGMLAWGGPGTSGALYSGLVAEIAQAGRSAPVSA